MIQYKCIYKGTPRNEGRFGNVTTGQELLLTHHEYKCVAEDPDFEFVEEVTFERKPVPSNPSGPSTDPKSPGTPGAQKEAGRVDGSSGVSTPPAVEDEDEDEDEDEEVAYTSLKKDELLAEVAERNEGREEALQLPTAGTKADLIAALEADDAR